MRPGASWIGCVSDRSIGRLLALAAFLFFLVPVLVTRGSLDPTGYCWNVLPFDSRRPGDEPRAVWSLYDQGIFSSTLRKHVSDRLRRGELPLWNPYIHAGAPLFGNGRAAILYPPELLFALLRGSWASFFYYWFHVTLALLGTFFLLRGWGLSPPPAVLAAVAYAGSGPVMVRLCGTPGAVFCWLPALLLAVDHHRRHRGRGSWVLLAAAVCLCILVGHHQTIAVNLAVALVYAAVVFRNAPGLPVAATRGLTGVLLAIAVGVAVAAVHWLPTAEYLLHSQAARERSGDVQRSHVLPLSAVIHVVSARILGFPGGPYLGQVSIAAGLLVHAGGLTAALAFVLLVRRRDGVHVRFTAGLWLVSLVMTFGLLGTPRLAAMVPGLGGMRLYYWGAVLAFCTSILGGMALEDWLVAGPAERSRVGRTLTWVAAGLALPWVLRLCCPAALRAGLESLARALMIWKYGGRGEMGRARWSSNRSTSSRSSRR